MRDWVANVETTHYVIGSVVGPHPFPLLVREFQKVIGEEAKAQILEAYLKQKGVADADIICAGHTHQATDRQIADQRAVNLGSVSNPITSDLRATYVIVNDDRHGHRLVHQRVYYDHDAVLAEQREECRRSIREIERKTAFAGRDEWSIWSLCSSRRIRRTSTSYSCR